MLLLIVVLRGVPGASTDERPSLTDDVIEALALLRAHHSESSRIEVEAAVGGLPRSVRDTLSAFSNDDGGLILLGISEDDGAFDPAPGFDAARTAVLLDEAAAHEMTPPVRTTIEIVEVEGHQVVAAAVPQVPRDTKPCFVTVKGQHAGSCTRSHEGDRVMTAHEITALQAERGQPVHDLEPMTRASLDELDAQGVRALLERVRRRQPRVFTRMDDAAALRALGVVVRGPDDREVPSLAGLITLGTYPQRHLPQLHISFVHLPGTAKGAGPSTGPRFLDDQSFSGPLPVMVEDAVGAVVRNMALRSTVVGVGRRDEYDYPVEAVREAVVNAVLHRDYSPLSRGTQVQIEMYADRLTVTSPGGLYGPVTLDTLGETSSSRNSQLAVLLADVPLPDQARVVCENRGSGIPVMFDLLRRAGMSVPRFSTSLSRFSITFPKSALLDAATVAWLSGLEHPDLTDLQRMALALMRREEVVDNRTLRQLGADSREATSALTDLTRRNLAVKSPGRRCASYALAPEREGTGRQRSPFDPAGGSMGTRLDAVARRQQVMAALADGAEHSAEALARSVGLRPAMTTRYLNGLITDGKVVATAPPRSRERRYRRT